MNKDQRDGGARPPDDHDRLWPLLPWYVNGTLGAADVARLEGHLAGCALCRGEVALLTAMEDEVRGLSVLEESMERNLDALHARLDGAAARPPGGSHAAPNGGDGAGGRWVRAWRTTPSLMRAVLGVETAAVTATILALVWTLGAGEPTGERFRLSSEPLPQVAETGWRVRFADDARAGALNRLLAELALTVVHGPTATGVYTLAPAAAGGGDDAARIDARLRASPAIAVAVRLP